MRGASMLVKVVRPLRNKHGINSPNWNFFHDSFVIDNLWRRTLTTSLCLRTNEEKVIETENEEDGSDLYATKSTIAKAMVAYMERASTHKKFIEEQEEEFQFGRRHLANMMGKNPDNFSQTDINEAIRYLFPSGLYETKARPLMRPPQEIYPRQKAAEFDMTGRPFHPFYYTNKSKFYELLHQMTDYYQKMVASAGGHFTVTREDDTDLVGSTWIDQTELESRLMEKISEKEYEDWKRFIERMSTHPNRSLALELIKSYRKPVHSTKSTIAQLPEPVLEEDGRKSVFVTNCRKKTSSGEVKVYLPGTGKFNINGQGLDYFQRIQSREAVIAPLQLVGWLGKVDVEASVRGGDEVVVPSQKNQGETSRAICIRFGIATAIAGLGADVEMLHVAGYLSPDIRRRERSKVAHVGARAAWTWKKR